jgi:hypothetical protein
MIETKACARCGNAYPATFAYFADSGRYSDGLKPYCRECAPAIAAERRQRKKERSKAWAEANREKARTSVRKSYQKNRSQRLAYMRQWRAANRERINAYQREYE